MLKIFKKMFDNEYKELERFKKIADEMCIEVTTVKYHVANMLQKTNLDNKLQLALAVSDAKLIVHLENEE